MFLTEFFQAVGDELRRLYADYLSFDGPTDRMRRDLRLMYGRGEITRDKFYQLKNMLDRGYYIEGELASLHHQAVNRRGLEGQTFDRPKSLDVSRSLDYVHINRAMLEEVRAEMRWAYHTVETQRQWMGQQVEDFYQRAQSAVADEDTARRYLEIRQQLIEQLQVLDQRFKMLQQELHRIDVLEAQLRLSESELMIVDSRERLAGVEVSVHKRLRW